MINQICLGTYFQRINCPQIGGVRCELEGVDQKGQPHKNDQQTLSRCSQGIFLDSVSMRSDVVEGQLLASDCEILQARSRGEECPKTLMPCPIRYHTRMGHKGCCEAIEGDHSPGLPLWNSNEEYLNKASPAAENCRRKRS